MADSTGSTGGGGMDTLVRLLVMLLLGGAVAFPFVGSDAARSGTVTAAPGKSASSAPPPAKPETEPVTDALKLLADFAGISLSDGVPLTQQPPAAAGVLPETREEQRTQIVRQELEGRLQSTVEFVIATVPDPIDSNARWLFDPMVAAISSAAAASDYVLDRFFIPDWDPTRDASADHGSSLRKLHERWPAIVVFRDAHFASDRAHNRLLVVSLVSETPTSGIHQAAFESAVSVIRRWNRTAVDGVVRPIAPIRVLGPNFSGSIASLTIAMQSQANKDLAFRVVSGGATNPENQYIVTHARANAGDSFAATVLPDNFTTCRTIEFLNDTASGARGESRIALLVEGNTTYGDVLGEQRSEQRSEHRDVPLCGSETDASAVEANRVFGLARRLPFPLHISRLRSAAQAQAKQQATPGPHFLTLPLDEPGAATDQIPSLSPGSTSASVELVIANILDTIDREHITTVGLLATDTRDKLFLAEQIARRDATVRLFTIESDLFYLHPDYSSYTRGMIVASTYPLFSQSVRRDGPPRGPEHQFSTTNVQGVYNGMLALLNYGADGKALAASSRELLDYFTPEQEMRRPTLWISAVGRDTMWPLRWYPATADAAPYLQRIELSGISRPTFAHPSTWTNILFLLLTITAAVHVVVFVMGKRLQQNKGLARGQLRFLLPDGFHRRTPYALAMFAALSVAFGYACMVFLLWVRALPDSQLWTGWELLTASAAVPMIALLVALLGCTLRLAWRCVRATPSHWRAFAPSNGARTARYVLMAWALLLAAVAAWYGVAYLNAVRQHDVAVYYFERVTHLQSGVSPVLPLGFLLVLIYMWAHGNMQRLTQVPGATLKGALVNLQALAPPTLSDGATNLQLFLDGAVRALPTRYVVVVGLILGVFSFEALMRPLATPEPSAFTWAFRACWLLVQLLTLLAFAQALYFWRVLRRSLKAFAGSPMVAAFDRLPDNLFDDRLSPRRTRQADVRMATRVGDQLRLAMPAIDAAGQDVPWTAPEYAALSVALQPPPAPGTLHNTWWPESKEWAQLGNAAAVLAPVVKTSWGRRRENMPATVDFDVKAEKIVSPSGLWLLRAEEFLAIQILFVVRELLARLVNLCFFIIVAVLLMVGAQHAFPFQPRQELLGTAWVYVLSAVAMVLWIFAQMERDAVLSAFASTTPGKVTWDATVWTKVLLYGVLPIATVFAAEFPQIGSTILGWLAPVQGVLR